MTNTKLMGLNELSETNYQRVAGEFRQNARTLVAMKKELDSIFKRIRYTLTHHRRKNFVWGKGHRDPDSSDKPTS